MATSSCCRCSRRVHYLARFFSAVLPFHSPGDDAWARILAEGSADLKDELNKGARRTWIDVPAKDQQSSSGKQAAESFLFPAARLSRKMDSWKLTDCSFM